MTMLEYPTYSEKIAFGYEAKDARGYYYVEGYVFFKLEGREVTSRYDLEITKEFSDIHVEADLIKRGGNAFDEYISKLQKYAEVPEPWYNP